MAKRTLTSKLGVRIRQLRTEKGLTLERLAWEAGPEEGAGLTKGYLSKIEQGQQRIAPACPAGRTDGAADQG